MSTTIDERVVEMRFDNQHFEKNVQTSIDTVSELKRSLNLTGACRGLENINEAIKSISLAGLTSAVDTVGLRFNALYTMADQAFRNITNSAYNYGKRIVSALTVDPIKTGFSEYETQINAVQTILANTESKGTTLENVNSALDELNKYADKTIYNFTEMTRNIGTFTAAGVDLDTSVSAIQGIANLAAVSGSTSQQASTAMYQLSQALASGTVKLQDWNSVVNAGMGGQVFQDALKRTAKVMGTDVDALIKKYGSFRESLTQGEWLTTDVLTETLNQFTMAAEEGTEQWEEYKKSLKEKGYTEEQALAILKMANTATNAATKVKTFTQLWDTLKESAQSGWTQSWEIVVGDFEEAKELLTEISNVIGELINNSAEARNEMLKGWKDLGGRTVLIEALRNAFEGVMSIVTPVKEAFREIFPATTSKQLYDITVKIRDLLAGLKLSEDQSDKLKRTFKGLFSILDIGKQLLTAVWNVIKPLFGSVDDLGNGVLDLTAKMGDWLFQQNEAIKKSDIFGKTLRKVADFIKKAIAVSIEFGSKAIVTVQNGISTAKEWMDKFVESAKAFYGVVKEKIKASPGFEAFHNFLERLWTRMEDIRDSATGVMSSVKAFILGVAAGINWEVVTKGMEGFLTLFGALWKAIKLIAGGIAKACRTIASGLAEAFGNADFDKTFDAINGGLLAGILLGIKKFIGGFKSSFDDIGSVTENLKDILDGVKGCLESFQQSLQAETLKKIATAIAILAAAIFVIALIDSEKLTASLGAVTVLFADLMGSMQMFSKMDGKNLKGVAKTISSMISLAVAVLVMAAALKVVASIDAEQLFAGLLGITVLMGELIAATKLISKDSGKVIQGAGSLVIFAVAIKVLTSAVKSLSALAWEELAKGLIGVGILMAEVSIFLNNTKFSGKAVSAAAGMVIMGAAIKILASACRDFAKMKWEEIGKGLAAIGALLTEIVLFTKFTGNAKNVVSTATAMVLIGAAMKIFASAVKDFAGMGWEELSRGLAGMAGVLLELTVALNLMPKNMIGLGAGLLVVSAAVTVLANAFKTMGGMSWEEIGRGLTVMAGSLVLLVASLHLMSGTLAGAAALIVAAGALAIIAPTLVILGTLSWEAIAKGLVALAGAFTVIGVAGALLAPIVPAIAALAGAFALVGVGTLAAGAGLAAAGVGLTAIAMAIGTLASVTATGATAIVAALTIIVVGVAALIPEVLTKVGEGIVALCNVLITGAPAICGAITSIIVSVVAALVTAIPVVIDGIFVLLASILTTLAEYTPTIVQAVFDVLIAVLQGIANNLSMVIQSAVDVVLAFIDGIARKIPDVIQAGFNLLLSLIRGITDAINTNTPLLVEAMQDLFMALLNAALTVLGGGVDLIKKAGKRLMDTGLIKSIREKFNEIKEVGKNIIAGLVDGIKSMAGNLVSAAKGVINDAIAGAKKLLGINSPSKVFAEFGMYMDEGMVVGLKKFAGNVVDATKEVGKDAIDSMSNVISRLTDVVNDDLEADPTITPVLDLSNVEAGTKSIDAMFSRTQAMNISASVNKNKSVDENSSTNKKTGNTYQFTQNNYSPKALSRIEIYRQTKNQFSSMERMVEA